MTWPEAFVEAVKYASMAAMVIAIWYLTSKV